MTVTLMALTNWANAQGDALEIAAPVVRAEEAPGKMSVPEPNTMLFAGIGGVIILIFAIRRK